jgi:ribosomal protein S18 acetylase RimI-like enzyme
VRVRQADFSDASALADLHGQAWREALSRDPADGAEEKWRALLAQKGTSCLLAEADGVAVGFVVTTASAPTASIEDLFVHRDYRRRGLGRRLISAALDALRDGIGCNLWVEDGNVAARRLYDSFGFVATGVTRLDERSQPPRPMSELALLPNSRQHRTNFFGLRRKKVRR